MTIVIDNDDSNETAEVVEAIQDIVEEQTETTEAVVEELTEAISDVVEELAEVNEETVEDVSEVAEDTTAIALALIVSKLEGIEARLSTLETVEMTEPEPEPEPVIVADVPPTTRRSKFQSWWFGE